MTFFFFMFLFFRLYQGLALWIEESRLHDPNLLLDSLPDVYMPDLLLKIFQGNQVCNIIKDCIENSISGISRAYSSSVVVVVDTKFMSIAGSVLCFVTLCFFFLSNSRHSTEYFFPRQKKSLDFHQLFLLWCYC